MNKPELEKIGIEGARALRRFWFPLSTGIGIGVTAATEAEARTLAEDARERCFPGAQFTGFVPDIDFSALDQNHVVPNASPVVVRGVWYPKLNHGDNVN